MDSAETPGETLSRLRALKVREGEAAYFEAWNSLARNVQNEVREIIQSERGQRIIPVADTAIPSRIEKPSWFWKLVGVLAFLSSGSYLLAIGIRNTITTSVAAALVPASQLPTAFSDPTTNGTVGLTLGIVLLFVSLFMMFRKDD